MASARPRRVSLRWLLTAALALAATAGAWRDPDALDALDADGEDDGGSEEDAQGVCFFRGSLHDKPVAKCCPGWEPSQTITESTLPNCRPLCAPECVNATCKSPNVCVCLDKYTKRSGKPMHVCFPQCQPQCVNAECVGVNVCRCKEGFQRTSLRHVCHGGGFGGRVPPATPLCSPPCGAHARCTGRNQCTCNEGYAPSAARPAHCEPLCAPACGPHARCAAPGVCECHEGYALAGEGACAAQCEGGCAHGECVAPGRCECAEGFEMYVEGEDEVCVPLCRPPCGRAGECVAPDSCSCERGFQLSKEGDCIGVCHNGSTWHRESQTCVSTSPLPTSSTTTSTTTPEPPPPPTTTPTTTTPTQPSSPPTTTQPPKATTPTHPPACSRACVHGRCVRSACECMLGWAGVECAQPCALRAGSAEFDPGHCPSLRGCTCPQPSEGGKSCTPGVLPKCLLQSEASQGMGGLPTWLWWAVAGGVVGALILFVVVPSAGALQRRHNAQRRKSRDLLHQGFSPGKGRTHEMDEQWSFIPN